MKNFQIKIVDKNKCGTYLYFSATEETALDNACEKANEYLEKSFKNDEFKFPFQSPFKPVKTINVVEYDKVNHITLRGGIKFKLKLNTFSVSFAGSKYKSYSYEHE